MLVPDYRASPDFGGGYPATFNDVACALAWAKQNAGAYGADPSRITLVAHSFGGFPGAVVALSDAYSRPPSYCQASEPATADSFVGLDAIYGFDRILPDFLSSFFGGTRETAASAWAAGDPAAIAKKTTRRPKITLVAGTNDSVVSPDSAIAFASTLRAVGIQADIVSARGADHESVLIAPETIEAILRAAGSAVP